MASLFRLAIRIQRFEVWSCVLFVTVIGITALVVRARLDAIGAPVECLTPWIYETIPYDAAWCEAIRNTFLTQDTDEAGLVMTAMQVLPIAVGLLLGVGLVGREIEGGTAPTVWALAGSRRRWLLGRLLPILAVLVTLLTFAAITSEILAIGRVPWQLGRPAFDSAGLHGPGVIFRGLAAFGLALGVGAWSGRMLPTVMLSALLSLFLWAGGLGLLAGWVASSAHEINVPSWYNGWYDGGLFVDSFYRLPDGSEVAREGCAVCTDPRTFAPAGVDPETWMRDEVQKVAVGVHSPDYPAWVTTEIAAFGAFGLVFILATFRIVDRRRPF
jgi:hypothetical protein